MYNVHLAKNIGDINFFFFCNNQSNAVINTIIFLICADKIYFLRDILYLELLSSNMSKIIL